MINSIELNIDLYEYQVLRIVCYRQFQLISAHFRVQKSATIEPALIVATLYSTTFSVSPELIKLKKSGYKKIKLHYYEAQALFNILGLDGSNASQHIRDKLDQEITNWKPTYRKNCEEWYKDSGLEQAWGKYEDVSEEMAEAIEGFYNKNYLNNG